MIKTFNKFFYVGILALIFSNNLRHTEAATLVPVSGYEFVKQVKSQEKDKNKLIFLFTSWCGHCKKSIPEIIQMFQDQTLKTDLIMLSLDKNQALIEKFVEMHMQNLDINIYYIPYSDEILEMFGELKINYRSTIPHITILNRNNTPIFDGFSDLKQIENILRQN